MSEFKVGDRVGRYRGDELVTGSVVSTCDAPLALFAIKWIGVLWDDGSRSEAPAQRLVHLDSLPLAAPPSGLKGDVLHEAVKATIVRDLTVAIGKAGNCLDAQDAAMIGVLESVIDLLKAAGRAPKTTIGQVEITLDPNGHQDPSRIARLVKGQLAAMTPAREAQMDQALKAAMSRALADDFARMASMPVKASANVPVKTVGGGSVIDSEPPSKIPRALTLDDLAAAEYSISGHHPGQVRPRSPLVIDEAAVAAHSAGSPETPSRCSNQACGVESKHAALHHRGRCFDCAESGR